MYFRPLSSVLWNLFLALVPVLLSFVTARSIRRQWQARGEITWAIWVPLLLVWLAFLPNTCYLLTEWRHYLETVTQTQLFFEARQSREAIFDLFLETGFYVFYSGTGLLTLFLAVWPLDRLARRRLGRWEWPVQALVFGICALGVYLGLVNRFNSWDLAHAAGLQAVWASVLEIFARPILLALIAAFGLILWLLYFLFDIWMDGAAARLHAHRVRRREGRTPHPAPLPATDSDPQEDTWHHASL